MSDNTEDFNLMNFYPKNRLQPKKGRILISEPFLNDPYFKKTVILLCEHNKDGSFGFVLNNYVDIKIQDLVEGLPDFRTKISLGGPVQNENLYYIHRLGEEIEGSIHIVDDIYMGGGIDVIKERLNTGEVSRDQLRFFIGYSGWSNNQLEDEIKENSWLVTEANSDTIMNVTDKNIWADTLKQMGKKYAMLSNFPENPSLN